MKNIILILLATAQLCLSEGTISPVRDQKGFIGGTISGSGGTITNLNLVNTTWLNAAGEPVASLDANGSFYLYDPALTPRAIFDPFIPLFGFYDASGNAIVEANATASALKSPIVTGNLTGKNSLLATNGVASFSTLTAVSIAATGWTNIWSTNNATVYVTGTAVTAVLKNRANATIVTGTATTGTQTWLLQPGWAVTISGTGPGGTAVPF